MDATYTYMTILVDTLQKKKEVLKQISELTVQQKQILQSEEFSEEEFQVTMDGKSKCLEELEQLDQGFEQIYERVALVLQHNKEMYKESIQAAQGLIRDIMELNVCIRAMEEQNKERFSMVLSGRRDKMKTFRSSNKVAENYYRNMPNIHQTGQTYFMDKKK